MTIPFKKQSLNGSSVIWADPSNVEHTVRAKVSKVQKNTSVGAVSNIATEVVNVLPADITKGTNVATESLSIRVRLSGSAENHAALKAEWVATKAHVDAVIDAGSLQGFIPADANIVSIA